jgi:hypothetical protein
MYLLKHQVKYVNSFIFGGKLRLEVSVMLNKFVDSSISLDRLGVTICGRVLHIAAPLLGTGMDVRYVIRLLIRIHVFIWNCIIDSIKFFIKILLCLFHLFYLFCHHLCPFYLLCYSIPISESYFAALSYSVVSSLIHF